MEELLVGARAIDVYLASPSGLGSMVSQSSNGGVHYVVWVRMVDAVFAAPNNYRLLYEDGHVRLIEVTVRPGETTPAHVNPYASVLAFKTVAVDEQEIVDTKLDAKSPLSRQKAGQGPAPSVFNMRVPTCTTVPPQVLHSIGNNSPIPLHYYRIEFKRVDGDAFQSHWREWYPWMKYMKNMR